MRIGRALRRAWQEFQATNSGVEALGWLEFIWTGFLGIVGLAIVAGIAWGLWTILASLIAHAGIGLAVVLLVIVALLGLIVVGLAGR
jgi:predicted PurR-regulated permease PerM